MMSSAAVASSSGQFQSHYEGDHESLTSENSSAEERDRKIFMMDLNKFMTEIGKPLSKIPIMGYKELDLYQLFKEVTAYGGFNEVVKNVGTWSKIWKRLANFDPSITDSSFRLKKNYERYLLEYEYKAFPDHRQQAMEFERQLQLKKSSQTQFLFSQANASSSSSSSNGMSEPSSPTIAMANLSLNGPSFNINSPNTSRSLKTSSDKIGKTKKTTKATSPTPSITTSSRPALTRSYSTGSLIKGANAAIYREIVRDKNGSPTLPLVLGELTVENLGTIIPRSPYVTERHVWPIGFTSSRLFASMINPETRVKYTSQITEATTGDKPQFVVTAEDDPHHPIIAHSPSAAWRTVLKRLMSKGSNAKTSISVSGTMRFGLAHPIVSHLIRELPGAERLSGINNINNGFEMSGSSNTAGSPTTEEISSSIWTSSRPKRKVSPRNLFAGNSSGNSSDDSSAEDSFDNVNSSSDSSPYNNVSYMDDYSNEAVTSPRVQKLARNEDHFSARAVTFTTREEMDDLESAVATLQALKYCAVY